VLLGDIFNVTEFEHANEENQLIGICEFNQVKELIESTIEETLGCTQLQALYVKTIDVVICTEFHHFFVYTLWPVGLGTIVFIVMITIGFLYEKGGYVVVSPI
jgi:hypothetical protein